MKAKYGILILLAMWGTVSCSDILDIPYSNPRNAGGTADGTLGRNGTEDSRRTLLVYSAAFHNLSSELEDDIDDICAGYVPDGFSYCDNLLVFTHNTVSYGNYRTPTEPCLIRVYRNRDGITVRDTVRTWPAGTSAVDTETLTDVLTYVHQEYPSGEYGMIFSSHATGWLPEGTFSSGRFPSASKTSADKEGRRSGPQKSIGQDASTGAEMDVKDFAAALPFRLDYIIFDACLMGGIETAYELRHKCGRIVFSSAEILADGMVYTNIVDRLLGKSMTDLVGVAEDFFTHYDSLTGDKRSATVSVVDCSALEDLAEACRAVFDARKGLIPGISPDNVQLANYQTQYFYDFRDILTEIASDEELREVDAALEKCVEYKANTEYFFSEYLHGSFRFETFCGLSMYLPSAIPQSQRENSNDYYSLYQWARDTGYIDAYYL